MDTIILYGDKKDLQIKNILLKTLPPRYQVNYISDNVLKSCPGKLAINLIETSYVNEIRLKNVILVLKNNAKINAIKYIDKSTKVVINSNNTKNILRLAKSLTNVYTCGFSSKDYVTFSSREEDEAVVSLQRSVRLTDGTLCEPMEIPCSIEEKTEDYSILASVLTMVFLNAIDENKAKF